MSPRGMSARLWTARSSAVLLGVVALGACGGDDRDAVSGTPPTAPARASSGAPTPAPGVSPPAAVPTTEQPIVEPVPAPPRTVSSSLELSLPAIDVDAAVIEAGVTASRVLQIPEDPAVLGRWADGARPGDGTGSVVLSGHVDYNGRPGALKPLASLDIGDEAVLTTSDGEVRYVTERVDTYAKQALPYQDIFLYDVPERLVLITCGGRFDRASGHYESNVVAYLRRV